MNAGAEALPLAALLRELARDVVATQAELDRSFVAARAASAQTAGALVPVWYRLDNVTIGLGLRVSVGGGAAPQLRCQLPDPVAVALYGSDRVTSTWLAVEIAPLVIPGER